MKLEYRNICMGCMGDKGEAEVCPHCGYIEGTPPPNTQYLPPRTILAGKYLLGRGLGHGGFGITYLAYDTVLKRKLAIKEYLPQDCANRGTGQLEVLPFSGEEKEKQFAYGVDKFLEEARTLAQFDGHPNIVGVRDFFTENNTAYLVMNYLSGQNLKDYLRSHDRALSYQQALAIMLPVMDALRTVHAAEVLHRDVSPDNIFLTGNGQVKLIDFGAARQSMGNRSISVILKPGYAPEEQYRSRGKQGPWTDVYATAATLYRAITGKVPPESLDRMEQDTLIPPSRMGVQIPAQAEKALLKAMAVRASDRYQSVQEFKDALVGASTPTGDKQPTLQRETVHPVTPPVTPVPPRAERQVQEPYDQRPRQHPNAQRVQNRPAPRPDPQTYPMKASSGKKGHVGVLVALLIVLVVIGGVLLAFYAIGNWIDGGLDSTPTPPAGQTTPGDNQTTTPSTSPSQTDQQATPSPTPEETPTPSPTPLPAGLVPGAQSSKALTSFVPQAGQVFTIQESGVSTDYLSGQLYDGLMGMGKLDAQQNPTDDVYYYFTDSSGALRYGRYSDQDAGTVYLPANGSVGTRWTSGGREFEIVAVDYSTTINGHAVTNCVVVKSGENYRFFVPGVGLHTIRKSLDEDTAASYTVLNQKGTSLSLIDLISVG